MPKALLLLTSACLLLLNFFNTDINFRPPFDRVENYDPQLSYINSISQLETYVDSTARQQSIAIGSYSYVLIVEKFN